MFTRRRHAHTGPWHPGGMPPRGNRRGDEMTNWKAIDRYMILSSDAHAGALDRRVPELSVLSMARRVRRVARRHCQSMGRHERHAQLELE